MCELTARLAAADAATVWDTLTGLARACAGPGDDRGLDQRRADVLVGVFTAIATGTAVPGLPGLPGLSGARRRRRRERRWRADVVVSAGTLLGLDDAPGLVPGYGPVPAAVARLVAADACWRRVLTDPVGGAVLDVGTRRYRPGAVIGGHVEARDAGCVFPGCVRRAVDCDLDHTLRFPEGPTAAHNLGPLCGHHHRLKHEARPPWLVAQPGPGRFTWTSPTGRHYTRGPTELPGTPEWAPASTGPPDWSREVPPY